VLLEEAAEFLNFFPGAAPCRKGVQHQLAGRPVENALQHVGSQLALGLFGGLLSFIDVCALLFVTPDQALRGHYLHEFQNGGVAEGLFFLKSLVNIADRGGPAFPEHLENLQLGGRWLLW